MHDFLGKYLAKTISHSKSGEGGWPSTSSDSLVGKELVGNNAKQGTSSVRITDEWR